MIGLDWTKNSDELNESLDLSEIDGHIWEE